MDTFKPQSENLELFSFEANHNDNDCQQWMVKNWAIGIYSSIIYILVIVGGQLYMRNRPRYELRYPLIAWSGSLAIFSMVGTARMAPKFFEDIFEKGFHYSLCDNTFMVTNKATSYWGYIFTISKIFELGDTLFIVLKKQKLIFLHYYHHITVLLYVWHSYPQRLATSRWFALMNFAVHSLMYTYYTLRAMKVKVPKFVNVTITFLQLLQMVIGLCVNIYTARMLNSDIPCAVTKLNLQYAFAMYISYFLLFLKFFYDTYIKKSKKVEPKIERKVSEETAQNGHALTNGYHKHKPE